MGLDLVEIVLEIEKAFEIELPIDEFEEFVHDGDIVVGDLYEHILRKVGLRDFGRYDFRLNYALWEELQGVIAAATQVSPEEVQLKTPLEDLFPKESRRATWRALREACPYAVRELDYPTAVRRTGLALAATMVLVEQFQVWQIPGARWLWPLLGLFGLWMLAETYAKLLRVLASLRTRFPSGMRTVKDLCRAILATNYKEICQAHGEIRPDAEIPPDDRAVEVWEKLRAILVEELGVDADKITFQSRLVRDLGMA